LESWTGSDKYSFKTISLKFRMPRTEGLSIPREPNGHFQISTQWMKESGNEEALPLGSLRIRIMAGGSSCSGRLQRRALRRA